MQTCPLKPTFTKEYDLFSSKKCCLQGLMWPKESSKTLQNHSVFSKYSYKSLLLLLPHHAQFLGFGKRSCSSVIAAYLSVFMNSRPNVARDTLWNSEKSNFQLAQMPMLLPGISAGAGAYLADSVPLCSPCPHLHIRGCLDFFTLLAFRGFEGL